MYHVNLSRTEFLAHLREPVPETVITQFEQDIKRHVETGIPVQHLTGSEFFYGREVIDNAHVLIPRPETEEVVLDVWEEVRRSGIRNPVLADVGTGSGVIAVTLDLELEEASIFATDLSSEALEVAEKNAKRLGARVTFLQGDFLQPLHQEQISPDILISNPPYIPEQDREALSDTVKDFDPALALFADEKGLAAYQQIITESKRFPDLKLLAFEIGHHQGADVRQLILKSFPESDVRVLKDINGKDRIVSARL